MRAQRFAAQYDDFTGQGRFGMLDADVSGGLGINAGATAKRQQSGGESASQR
ncbi:hypothetical protein D3C76_1526630 [compost metagenome]